MVRFVDERERRAAISVIVFIVVVGVAGSYYFSSSDTSAILCTIFGFFSVKYVVDDKFTEKVDGYF